MIWLYITCKGRYAIKPNQTKPKLKVILKTILLGAKKRLG